jgi:hypothetical protein
LQEPGKPAVAFLGFEKDSLMLYKLGRVLQLLGLAVLPIAMAGNAAERLTLKDMLVLTATGILVFFVGWLLQQSSKPN